MEFKEAISRVKAFHEQGGHPRPARIAPLPHDRRVRRAEWMAEEVQEFVEAADLTDQIDALVDLLYFLLGTAVEIGLEDLSEPFAIVHRANYAKVVARESQVVADDGKIEKPAGWVDPRVEMAGFLTQRVANRRLVASPDMDCLPAVLVMALERLECEVAIEEVRSALPPAVALSDALRPEDAGINVGDEDLRKALAKLDCAIEVERVKASQLSEMDFAEALQSATTRGEVIVGVDISVLDPDVPSVGHVFVVDAVAGDWIWLIDPGPKTEGIRVVRSDDLYAAVSRKGMGFWVLSGQRG